MADRKEPRPVPPGAVKPEPPPAPPKRLISLEISRAQAEILAIALFAKIQFCEKHECDIHNWGGVDMWDLYCQIGQFIQVLMPEAPPNRETREGVVPPPPAPPPDPGPERRQGGWYPPPVTEPPAAPPPPPPPPNGIAEWRKAVDEKLLEHEREIEQLQDQISELVRNAD